MLGSIVATEKNAFRSNSMVIRTEDFEQGFYTLKIYYSGGFISARKIVVKH
jgi:hypothetical protein